ncbi:hypothetical protein VPH35_028616 [Triticum aestivum]
MGRVVATISPLQMAFLRRPTAGDLASANDHCCSTPFSSCLSPLPRRSSTAPPATRLAARTVRTLWKNCAKFPGVGSIPLPRRGVHAPLPEPGIQELLSAHGDLLCAAPPLFLRITA